MNSTASNETPLVRLWWLEPASLFALVIGGTMLAAAAQSEQAFLLYGAPKFIALTHVILAAAAIVAFGIGVQLARLTGPGTEFAPAVTESVVKLWFWIAFWLALLGYAIWVAVGIKNGFSLGMLREFLTTDDPLLGDQIRTELFVSLRGITTATQFGLGAVLLGLWLYFRGYRATRWPIVLLFVFALLRALVFSERLALIELIVPAAVVLMRVRLLGRSWSPVVCHSARLAPLLAVAGLIGLFGAFEYFRSWRYYKDQFDSYAEFTLWRVTGYYTTAHNNSAMALQTQPPYPIPYVTLRHLWSMPGLDKTPLDYRRLTGVDPAAQHEAMLERYGTPELNNEGGLFQPALDFGIAGMLLFWFGCGMVSGRLYVGFLSGTLAGLTLYPLIVLAILETPRLLYLCYTRSLPSVALLLLVTWLAVRPARQPVTLVRLAATPA